MNLFAGKRWRLRPREETCGYCGGRRGRDEKKQQHWNIYIAICKIDSQWKSAVRCRQLRPGALWQPRGLGWGGRSEGGSRVGDICIIMTDSCGYMAETNTVIVKQLLSNWKYNFFFLLNLLLVPGGNPSTHLMRLITFFHTSILIFQFAFNYTYTPFFFFLLEYLFVDRN